LSVWIAENVFAFTLFVDSYVFDAVENKIISKFSLSWRQNSLGVMPLSKVEGDNAKIVCRNTLLNNRALD
jgi:hypothetical protein